MKRLRHFCGAALLTFTLALSTSAGNIECGDAAPPPQQSAVMADTYCGDTGTCETPSTEIAFVDPVTGLALDIMQSLLALF